MRSARSVRLLGPTVFEGAVPVSVAFSPKRSHDIAAVAGGRLLFFDLRSERVILDEARCAIDVLDDGSSYSYGEEEEEEEDADAEVEVGEEASDADDDEINAVSYSPDGAFVATADDGGEINVFERRRGGSDWARRACIVGHDNIASAAAWCPAAPRRAVAGGLSPLPPLPLLLSGAFDMTVALWQLRRPSADPAVPPPRSCVRRCAIEGGDEGEDGGQLLNPPFVHAVAWSESGDAFAVGGGDGDVRLFWRRAADGGALAGVGDGGGDGGSGSDGDGGSGSGSGSGSDEEEEQWALEVGGDDWGCGDPLRLTGGHSAAVNVVHWAQRTDGDSGDGDGDDRAAQLLLSAGEDRSAVLWRVPSRAGDLASGAPRVMARIALPRKPNCAVAIGSDVVVVGDTSKELHVFRLKH